MFNLIFSSIQAYTQIGLFLGALVCVGLGGLILGNSLTRACTRCGRRA